MGTSHNFGNNIQQPPGNGNDLPTYCTFPTFTSTSIIKESKESVSGFKANSLSFWSLVSVTFFTVSGGAYGYEDSMAAVGPFFVLLLSVIIPCIWSLPTSLVSCELATTIPETGGPIVWIAHAAGPSKAGQYSNYLNCLVSFFCNCVDTTVYVVIALEYLEKAFGDFSLLHRSLICLAFIGLVTVLNLTGVDLVGWASIFFAIFVIAPFIVMFGFGVTDIKPSDWSYIPSNLDWGTALSVILWQMTGFDLVASFTEEVQNPKKILPRACIFTIIFGMANCMIPVVVGISVDKDYGSWTNGTFEQVGNIVAGRWLGWWVLITGALSCLGQLNANLATTSRETFSMCKHGVFPPVFRKVHSKFKTPYVAVLWNALFIFGMSFLPFKHLIQIDGILTGVSIAGMLVAFVALKFKYPDLERPYAFPGGKWGGLVAIIPPTILALTVVFFADAVALLLSAATVIIATFMFVLDLRWPYDPHRMLMSVDYAAAASVSDTDDLPPDVIAPLFCPPDLL
eukprot:GCRY01000419.1.p1 GENE.GCRY01000419.1~~GCRY01000419.1.p1  ORF type:complete len:511 (-),score=85.71 GCRY01000419.1:93-1625(-)